MAAAAAPAASGGGRDPWVCPGPEAAVAAAVSAAAAEPPLPPSFRSNPASLVLLLEIGPALGGAALDTFWRRRRPIRGTAGRCFRR